MSPRSNRPVLSQRSTSKKHVTSMSCTLKPAIWSCDTSQQIPCLDRCQLIITWMSNIKEVHGKPRLHVSVNLLFGVWPPSCATPSSSSPSPTSNTAGHDNHKKVNSWVSFSFIYKYGTPLGGPWGRRSSAIINVLVFSKLFYCSSVWSNTTQTNLENLDKLQAVRNFACRILCGAKKNRSHSFFAKRLALANQATALFPVCCSGFLVHDEMYSGVFGI